MSEATRQYRFLTADVFTSSIFAGNALAIFPDADGLDGGTMQRIARELNLSETTFVLPPSAPAHACRLRIFTPGAEMPFAGHPTVGTAIALASLGRVDAPGRIVVEVPAGPVPVTLRRAPSPSGGWFARLTAPRLPELGPAPPPADRLAKLLGLQADDIGAGGLQGLQPVTCSAGVPFTFVPLRDVDAVRRTRFDIMRWREALATSWAPSVYVFALPGEHRVHARMFAPSLGVPEDPATGAAAVALAGVLAPTLTRRDGTVEWTIAQGVEMGRPSTLHLEAELAGGELAAVHLGGEAVVVSEGTMRVPVPP